MCREEGEECEASLAREDIMERSMMYEGFVKSEGVYEGRGEGGHDLTGEDDG